MGFQDVLIIPPAENCDILKHVKHNLITKLENKNAGLSIRSLIALEEKGFFS